MRTVLRTICVGALMLMLGIATTALAQNTGEATLYVAGAWARPGAEMSAAYLHISNRGDANEQLIAVRSDTGMAEIHETRMEGDVMRMRPVESLDIPAGETAHLEPGGYHIMLMGLGEPLVEGDQVTLTLLFASGAEITVEAGVSHTPVPKELAPDALTAQALAAVAARTYVGQVVNPPIQVQDFSAPGTDEDLTRLGDTDGTWRVIFFGYMHCPDFCPLTLVDYRQARALLGAAAAEEVTFLFISVDSARDTPAIMRRYLDNFDPAFAGFSPDDDTLSQIQPDYNFYYERRLDEGTQAIYTIDHSTRSYVLDRDGVLRTSFAYDTDPQSIADALLWYLEHE